MTDIDKILGLVAEGRLTPDEADEIISALNSRTTDDPPSASPQQSTRPSETPRHLRIEVTERGRRVINLRVPVNIAGWASFLPGLSDQDSDRIRGAIASGIRGAILDIGDDDDRVLITSE
jgi:hypothetical protein